MNLQEFKLNIKDTGQKEILAIDDASIKEITSQIENKLRVFDAIPQFILTDSELKQILENHERLKKTTLQDLQDLQFEFERKLSQAKTQYDKDLAFMQRMHTEKINQINSTHTSEINDAVKDYKEEIEYLQGQLEELSAQRKRVKFQRMKNFFFREMRDAKKKVQVLNLEKAQMKTKIEDLKKELNEMKYKLGGQRPGGDAQNYKQFTKVEIQFFSKKDAPRSELIQRSDEIKRKLDTLDDAGYTDKIITEIVNEYSRIEMVLNNFKQYNKGFVKRSKLLK